MALKRIKVATLEGSPVSVWYSEEWQEYVVKLAKKPNASYHTSDKNDALRTAQVMRNTVEV